MGSWIKAFLETSIDLFSEKNGFKIEKIGKKSLKNSNFEKNPQLITVKDFNFYIFMTPRPSTFKIWTPIFWRIFLILRFRLAQCACNRVHQDLQIKIKFKSFRVFFTKVVELTNVVCLPNIRHWSMSHVSRIIGKSSYFFM